VLSKIFRIGDTTFHIQCSRFGYMLSSKVVKVAILRFLWRLG